MNVQKTIAIWAPLKYANYGDDLQAIILGKFILDNGYGVKIFQLEKSLAEKYNLISVDNVRDLISGSFLCVIAGGSFLMPIDPIKRWLHPNYREIENSYGHLFAACKKYGCQLLPISIGGDGYVHKPFWEIPIKRFRLLKSDLFMNGTVRLKGDLDMMKRLGKDFKFYPDMLLQAGNIFNIPELNDDDNKKLKVGLNLKRGKYLDEKLVQEIISYSQTNSDMDFYFIKSHMDKVGIDYEYLPKWCYENIHIVKYENPEQMLYLLSILHCVISSKLHIGLTAVSVGTPFLSYRGQGKTKAFLKSIGGEWAILNDNVSFKDIMNILRERKRTLYEQYNNMLIVCMTNASLEHFSYCLKVIRYLEKTNKNYSR